MIKNDSLMPSKELSAGALSILNVAETLFANKGFSAVSINEVAQASKVSKANIFHHFKSKEALYLAVLRQACNRSAVALDFTNNEASHDPLEKMRHFFSSHLNTLLSESLSTQLIQRELMENSEHRGKQLAEEVFADSFSKVQLLVREAQAHHIVRQSIDPSLLAFLLLGANVIFFEAHTMLKHLSGVDFAESPEIYSSTVFDLLINGFKE